MMARFEDAVEYVLQNETSGRADGAFTDDPLDEGGATKWGISSLIGRKYGIKTDAEMRDLTRERAIDIYRSEFWQFSNLVDQITATKLFDMVVNLGGFRAVQLVQVALSWSGRAVHVDGKYGLSTEQALNSIRSTELAASLVPLLEAYYHSRVVRNASQKRFINGWLQRARRMP